MNIIEFLEVRIAEDEQEAKACLAQYERGEDVSKRRWTRMLGECKVKLAIVDLHSPIDPCDAHDEQMKSISCDTLRALAAIYSDHPDYKDEWTL
ncbi:DUF6221 family protein [Glutamicibacter sp. FBE19]|uniref:DUF6221 family protein n=1 Tax=Glutamicibacter sp. FBE19 TaxID=2761534 RepID=UPI0018963F38|nr:DUF6221 family protein [Glutamicibacter sp. FBE19]MBF6672432.1 hypothetical protein [Glutamicibacter sp. FBE19]